ncbi:8035_t:CDS:2 [Diversispora eburnea]|uniref:8035_t:CDS:1 n=1 Tax=Diversispora eburnea TaxID=1213867 RepID=A0A9N8Z1Z8_9GLOM|nr:8035_t:CDS:2 [Diversispora eburnea]
MKFGSQIKATLHLEWKNYYVDYDGLKKILKQGEEREGGYTDKDETAFFEKLDKELEKVYTFQNTKYEEIKNRVQSCEKIVESVSKDRSLNAHQTYSDIKRQINSITEELNELAKYARLNYTGIIKIIKKHDRRTRYFLRPMFSVRLNACPFYKETFEPVIVNLSRLYHIVQRGLGGDEIPPNFSNIIPLFPSQEKFFRQSRKFWVHPDNVVEVETTILRHLPVLIYKPGTDSSVHSIYFDNDSFELYQDKVDRKPGDQLIRLRWYGKVPSNDIFVERKVRQGDDEIKERFAIKEKYTNALLKGEYSLDKRLEKMKEHPGTTEEEIQNFQTLVKEIQNTIVEKKLQPVLRTYYNRMAFQIPGDSSVRVSFDTQFYMIREDNFGDSDDSNRRRNEDWRRRDIDDDNFNKLPPSECVKFPYAVLEVKLNLSENELEPDWVQELASSHLVEAAPQFSKYVHGVATLFTSQAQSLPYWLPNIDKDILKPPTLRQPSEANEEPAASSSSMPSMITPSLPKDIISEETTVEINDDSSDIVINKKGKAVVYTTDDEDHDENTPLLEGEECEEEVIQHRPIGLRTFSKIFRKKSSIPDRETSSRIMFLPPKVTGPIQVEPKVYFANERTFFSWLRFCVLLGSLALGLFNSAAADNKLAIYCAVSYTSINDLIAPGVVCAAIFIATGLNFYLKLAPRVVEGNDGNNKLILQE